MSHQPIRLGSAFDFVELAVLERGALPGRDEGDIRLGVSVRCETFAGSYDQVWIASDDWLSFLAGLTRIERDRSGDATLLSMSPDEFELRLRVENCDASATAHGYLSRYHFGFPSGTVRSKVYFSASTGPATFFDHVLGSLIALREPAT